MAPMITHNLRLKFLKLGKYLELCDHYKIYITPNEYLI